MKARIEKLEAENAVLRETVSKLTAAFERGPDWATS